MYLSLNWLKDFVNISEKTTPEQLGLDLTMHTTEVENIKNVGASFKNIVVGRVKDIKKHPNADKLVIAIADIGSEELQIVCGGINLKKGMPVAVALPGARVRWHGEGEPAELGDVKIRGIKSQGMICAAGEIGLEDIFPHQDKEILDLTQAGKSRLKPGDNLASALNLEDAIYEIDNKSLTNRPDLWGHYGLAREIAAFGGGKLCSPKIKSFKEGKVLNLKVEVRDYKLCPRYCGIILDNIKVEPSPLWLRLRLRACGLRPINNVVDVTNFVMLELGQPLHAFNARSINNNKIIVRSAKPGEKITTLDGVERLLDDFILVIADNKKALALAGIMGDKNSAIEKETTSIVLESANFDAVAIRRTSKKLGLRSDSSMRFEKSLDPNLALLAIKRAVNLLRDLSPQTRVASNLVDLQKIKLNQGPITLSWDFLNRRIGKELAPKKVINILERLGFIIEGKKDHLSVTVPTWRATGDIKIAEDLLEEIARVYGYDKIEPMMPRVVMKHFAASKELELAREVKFICAYGLAMREVYNYSFLSDHLLKNCGFKPDSCLRLSNALSGEISLMRPSLLPGFLAAAKENLKNFDNFNLFELGRVFKKEKGSFSGGGEGKDFLPKQHKFLAGLRLGEEAPFYQAKNDLEIILKKLNFSHQFIAMKGAHPWVHPVRVLSVAVDGKVMGLIAELNPLIVKNFAIEKRVAYWEIDFSSLARVERRETTYHPLPKYPGVELDLAVVVSEEIAWADLADLAKRTAGDLLKRIGLFDVYRGKGMPTGKKSLAFHLVYRSSERTLELEEARGLQEKIIKALEKNFNAKVRD